MVFLFIRLLLLFSMVIAGYVFTLQQNFFPVSYIGALWGAIISTVIAFILFYFANKIKGIKIQRSIWSLVGLLIGFLIARITMVLVADFSEISKIYSSLYLFLALFFGYIGMTIGYFHSNEFSLAHFIGIIKGSKDEMNIKLLDTSVIIDGRIADICETSFIEGTLVIPQFILNELQHIADSADSLKRNRGRRGLDILQKIQKLADVDVEIVEKDFPKIREVDAKLVELGKVMKGKILTNDFNLNKIAELQGITVLNINELANALKPVVLPGEEMNVYVLKEGKEMGQGVAYLDDGTMVVVDNALEVVGQNVIVSVTSVLQTTAGRMIFSRLKEIQ